MRHLTKRAIEAFVALAAGRKSVPPDDLTIACTGTSALGEICPGGEVVTAIYVAIVAGGGDGDVRPTCPACGVLLDEALETQRVPAGVGARRSSP